jgi:hypothetical protein
LVDLAEIQAAYYMVAATGVLVAAVFYVLNLRISRRNQELMLRAQEQSARARARENLATEVRERQPKATPAESLLNEIKRVSAG